MCPLIRHERADRQFAYAIMAQRHNVPSRATATALRIGMARYRSSRTCGYRPHHATTARDVDWEWNGVRSGHSVGNLAAVSASSTGLLDSVFERSNRL